MRSSALGEDSAEATFAGQQDTYLWVRGLDAICEAVQKCWASLYNPEAVAYRERFGVENPAMGVTVQLMVDAAVSGVMFTCNPVSGDRSMVAVNASWGLGLAVVGGEVTPDDYLVSKITGEVVRQTINDKAIEYVPGSDGPRRVDVADERRDSAVPHRSRPICSPSLAGSRATSARPRTSSGRSTATESCSSCSRVRSPAWPRRRRRRRPAPPCR